MKKILIGSALWLMPALALAQTGQVGGILTTIGNIINQATPIVVALALLYFFWGLANYVLRGDDPDKKSSGKMIMIQGLVVLFIMVSVWGIIRIVQQTFNVGTGAGIQIPKVVPGPTGGFVQ